MMRTVTGWVTGVFAGLSRNLQLVSLSLFFWGFGKLLQLIWLGFRRLIGDLVGQR